MSETIAIALITGLAGLLGGGGVGTLIVRWVLARVDAKADAPTTTDIDDIKSKLDRDWEHLQRQDATIRDIQLTVLRQCLFARPHDRNSHESALQSGQRYLDLGGNGVGHVRLDQLQDDYKRRVRDDDWDYTSHHKEETS